MRKVVLCACGWDIEETACIMCGGPCGGKRCDKKTCSLRCRVALSRKLQRQIREMEAATKEKSKAK